MCKPSPDEKLQILHNIRDRRLKEKADSKHRMEDVCKLIPNSLSDVDLENTGWCRGCHQRFTMSLNRLQSESQATLDNAKPSSSHSPQKNVQKKVMNLYSHMASVYSVTRRQQHLEEKCSSQLRHL